VSPFVGDQAPSETLSFWPTTGVVSRMVGVEPVTVPRGVLTTWIVPVTGEVPSAPTRFPEPSAAPWLIVQRYVPGSTKLSPFFPSQDMPCSEPVRLAGSCAA